MRVTPMGAGGVDLAERPDEGGQVDGGLLQVVDRAVGVLAGQPLVDRPLEGIALGRVPSHQLDGKRDRQVWGELGQPLRFGGSLPGRPADTRQPSGQVVAKPVDVVVGPVGLDRVDRQVGQVRELPGQQASHERDVGVGLLGILIRAITVIMANRGDHGTRVSPQPGLGDNHQMRSLVLWDDLVGSSRIWPAHVGRVVDPDGSRRIVWMLKRRGAASGAAQTTGAIGGAGTRHSIW